MEIMASKIDGVFNLFDLINQNEKEDILIKIESIIFLMLIKESKIEVEKINSNNQSVFIQNRKLQSSASFERTNRGGDITLHKSLIGLNNERLKTNIQKEILLNEKIDSWKSYLGIHTETYTNTYSSLKPDEKVNFLRTELNQKSNSFNFKIHKIIAPIIYFNILKYLKFELLSIENRLPRAKHLLTTPMRVEDLNYYQSDFNELIKNKENYENIFNQLSNEFINLYNQPK